MDYDVVLLDVDGFEVATAVEQKAPAAMARAKYMLSDAYARALETTHAALGTAKVEVRRGSDVLYDLFRKGAA